MFNFLHGVLGKIALGISTLLVGIAGFIAPSQNIATSTPTATTTVIESSSVQTTSVNPSTKKKTAAPETVSQTSNQTKPDVPTAPMTTSSEQKVAIGSVATNPSLACLPIKAQWETFSSALFVIESKFSSLQNIVSSTGNEPKDAPVAYFSYQYNKFVANQSKFNSGVSELNDLLEKLPQPPGGGVSELLTIKAAYTKASGYLQEYYSTSLQAFKIIGSDSDKAGASLVNINSAQSLYEDAMASYNKISPSLTAIPTMISMLENSLKKTDQNGCSFVFSNGTRTIVTTIPDELTFTQNAPIAEIAKDYPPSFATLVLNTTLPIEINVNGKAEIVMKLSCNNTWNGKVETWTTTRTNTNQVSATIKPATQGSFVTRECTFVYTGSGVSLKTKSVDVRI